MEGRRRKKPGGRGDGEKNGRSGSGVGRDRCETQRARRMYENLQLLGVEGGRNLLKAPETWDGGGSQESMQVTLARMLNSEDMEPEEATSSCSEGIMTLIYP